MNKIILTFFLVLYLFTANSVSASFSEDFNKSFNIWENNISLARNYLRKAELFLKDGNYVMACKNQEKASIHGILATKSLINAFTINEDEDNIKYLESTLNKWKKIGNQCE
tara:strand:- start:5175 stop:5507 length:333 start_codon:yes stop_codon:yes gene_type:complete